MCYSSLYPLPSTYSSPLFIMCNQTSLSAFLEGVNFMDEDVMNLELELEEDLLCEDGLMLDMDVDEVQHALLNGKPQLEEPQEPRADMHMEFLSCDDNGPLPPLDFIENDAELAALMADSSGDRQSATQQLEKLAHCMRQSEMTLRQQQSILAKAMEAAAVAASSPSTEEDQCFAKANLFFTGHRATITPELEQSRQSIWSMIQQQHPVWTQKPHTTAAA